VSVKLESAGAFLRGSGQYVHSLELDWLSTVLLDALRAYTTTFPPDASWDYALTPVPQNLHYPAEEHTPGARQSVTAQNEQTLERRDQHYSSHHGGRSLSHTFLSLDHQVQAERNSGLAAL
jgi:hypothetical protein